MNLFVSRKPMIWFACIILSVFGANKATFAESLSSEKRYTREELKELQKPVWKNYVLKIQKKIKSKWKPEKQSSSQKVSVLFNINKDGSIGKAEVYESSGNDTIDDSALAALVKAAPFDPWPEQPPQNKIVINFTFDYRFHTRDPESKEAKAEAILSKEKSKYMTICTSSNDALKNGDFKKSLSILTDAIDSKKELTHLIYPLRGSTYMMEGKVEIAIEDLDKFVEVFPLTRDKIEIYRLYPNLAALVNISLNSRIICAMALGQFQKAIDDTIAQMQLKKQESPLVDLQLAELYLIVDDRENSFKYLDHAEKMAPRLKPSADALKQVWDKIDNASEEEKSSIREVMKKRIRTYFDENKDDLFNRAIEKAKENAKKQSDSESEDVEEKPDGDQP